MTFMKIMLFITGLIFTFNSCEYNHGISFNENYLNDVVNLQDEERLDLPQDPKPPSKEPEIITLDSLKYIAKEHPRLVSAEALEIQLATLFKTAQSRDRYRRVKQTVDAVIESGEFNNIENSSAIPNWRRGEKIAQRIRDAVEVLSNLYLIEKDQKYLNRLWLELQLFSGFENWNDKVFLDTVMVTNAVSYAYDIFYNEWTPAQRKIINAALIRNAIKPAIKFYLNKGSGVPWAFVDHNWNALANAAVVKTLIAFDDSFDEIDENGLFKASIISNKRFVGVHYAPSGATTEGPNYWSSGTISEVVYLNYLQLALGSTFGLLDSPGFSETGYYAIYMQSPTGKVFNYSDTAYRYGDGADLFGDRAPPYTQNLMFYLGKYFDNPYFIDFARKFPNPNSYSPLVISEMEKSVPPPDYTKLPLSRLLQGYEIDVVTMRESWNRSDALFAGIKAGKGNASHSQLDQGTIMIHDLGEQWLVDLGNDDYGLKNYFHTSLAASPNRYDYFTNRTEAHNCLIVNFENSVIQQNPAAQTAITNYADGGLNKTTFAIANLTPAYTLTSNPLDDKNYLKKYHRGLAMVDRKWILLQDEITPANTSSINGWWLIHTLADIKIIGSNGKEAQSGTVVQLNRNGKSYYLKILGADQLQFEMGKAKPLSLSPNPAGQIDAVARGVKRLAIRLTNYSGGTIRVAFTPDLNIIPKRSDAVTALENWTTNLHDTP